MVRPVPAALAQLASIAREGAAFRFVFTYSGAYEGGEIARRQLPALSEAYLNGPYREALAAQGFLMERAEALEAGDARTVGTRWAKRLAAGRSRTYYRVEGFIQVPDGI